MAAIPPRTRTIIAICSIAGAVVGVLIGAKIVRVPFLGASIERQILQFSQETNKRLPVQLDAFTRWDRVAPGPGRSYSNIYTLEKILSDEEKEVLRSNVTRNTLALPDMKTTFDAGVTVWYKYYDTTGNLVFEFPVRK